MNDDSANRGDIKCPECWGTDFTEEIVSTTFQYGASEADSADIPVKHPVITCEDCGYSFTDERAEWARHCAVNDYRRSRDD